MNDEMKNLANDSSKRESYNGYGEFQDDKLKHFVEVNLRMGNFMGMEKKVQYMRQHI
ncbi:MAG: hypothetical protein IPI30_12050 [Saprospiraceae bacterium]|nr:hypothetical protein [Candidatus Vicinibacter affinis]